jgi:MFS transporter, DHA1 family, inner membrane transport protein
MTDKPASRLVLPIIGATFFRLVLNTARRFVYPFAPALSRGLGVSLSSITSVIAISQLTALLGALIGPFSDRLGYRKMMIAGMAMLGVGMLAAAIFPFFAVILVALFLAGLGKSIFDPAVQAWASSQVPFHRRALVIGLLEISWAASTLVGIPLVAILMDRYGWQSPFLAMGVLGCIGMGCLVFLIPAESDSDRSIRSRSSVIGAYGRLLSSRPAVGALGYAFFTSAGNDNLFVVYGAWLEKSFGLDLVALGLGTSLIGIAELAGEGLTASLSDRIGLKRAVILGIGLSVVSYFTLFLWDSSLSVALTALAILFLLFEFAMVSSLSLCTELLPGLRATMMSGFLAMAGIGRAFGALMGGAVWQHGGIFAIGCVSGLLTLMGIGCLIYGLRGWRQSPE